jgi:hypothetical protein
MGNKRADLTTVSGYGLRRVSRLQCRKEEQDGAQIDPLTLEKNWRVQGDKGIWNS